MTRHLAVVDSRFVSILCARYYDVNFNYGGVVKHFAGALLFYNPPINVWLDPPLLTLTLLVGCLSSHHSCPWIQTSVAST